MISHLCGVERLNKLFFKLIFRTPTYDALMTNGRVGSIELIQLFFLPFVNNF